ncbi:MAG: LysE family transporter [Bacteroidota bacterium]|nr:LysE family transporter [Bacteroidota bacterium]
MSLLFSFLLGVAVGILMTLPLGPTSIYVAQRTLNHETRKAMHVALGSVLIDILYCLIISLGLIALVRPYLRNEYVQLAFSLFLIVFGIRMLFFDGKRPAMNPGEIQNGNGRQPARKGRMSVLIGTMMALSNPTLFISWTAVIGFLSANGLLSNNFADKLVFSFAAGFGGLLWFLGLALFIRSRRHTLSQRFVRIAGAVSAVVVIIFGIYFAVTTITGFGEKEKSFPGMTIIFPH